MTSGGDVAGSSSPRLPPEVIPAIDLLDGKAVRLRQGRYEEATFYPQAPELIASEWAEQVGRLHVVDLEGARQGGAVQIETVTRVLRAFGGGVQLGGGIRTYDAMKRYLDLGADRVVLGTAALKDPELVARAAEEYPGKIVVAVDGKNGFVASEGWLEQSERRARDLVRDFHALPIAAVLYTDIDRDGTEVGPNVRETARLASETGRAVLASGGVGTLEHLRAIRRGASEVEGTGAIVGVIVGRALHEKRFTLGEAVAVMREPA